MRRKQSGKNELGLFGASEKEKEMVALCLEKRTGNLYKYQIQPRAFEHTLLQHMVGVLVVTYGSPYSPSEVGHTHGGGVYVHYNYMQLFTIYSFPVLV